jgi:23S rRNA pseudouridine2605 synthase
MLKKNDNNSEKGIRIAKYIAHASICSRREAEELIVQGSVKVNGQVIDSPATIITDQSVKVNDKLISLKNDVRLFIFHKPKGIITTNKDEKGRKTIFDILPKNLPRLISVGRLDFNTEGLILFTNNGDFARFLELPKNKITRVYRARVFGKIDIERLKRLDKGITINGVKYRKIKVKVDSEKESNSWLTISLEEGKNREIRKVMEEIGLIVNRLIRVSYSEISLGDLKVGEIQEIHRQKIHKIFSDYFKV